MEKIFLLVVLMMIIALSIKQLVRLIKIKFLIEILPLNVHSVITLIIQRLMMLWSFVRVLIQRTLNLIPPVKIVREGGTWRGMRGILRLDGLILVMHGALKIAAAQQTIMIR